MKPKMLSPQELREFVARMLQERKVMAPVFRDGVYVCEWLENAEELALPAGGIPRVSAKKALLPPTEVLFHYKVGKATEATVPPPPPKPQVLFGVHPCDVRGIKVLDAVFSAQPHPDGLYTARRRVTTIVGLGIPADRTPGSCFFERLGISSMDSTDCDLFLTELGNGRCVVEVLTAAGEALTSVLVESVDATDADLAELSRLREDAQARATHDIDPEALRDKLGELVDSGLWSEIGETCIGCGACAYLCPTCHCFDIQDERHGEVGCRVRNWDTCQFDAFTKHASGHNPRTAQNQRARQRIMHKFAYGYANFGIPFCIGCGRCIAVCPLSNDVRDVLARIAVEPQPGPEAIPAGS